MEIQDRPQAPSLWRNRDYMLLWSGQVVSNVGTNASGIAFPLLILALTGSSFQAGVAGALQRLPFLFLTLPAGALVDRWNRKLVMIVCDSARALAFAAIPLGAATGRLGMPLIYAVVLVEGTAFSFYNLAETSALPRVVPREQLPSATAQNQASFAFAMLTGPPIAGLVYGIQRTLPFLVDAVSYAASVVSLFFIRRGLQGERAPLRRSLRDEIGEGLHWLWGQPLIRFMAVITGGLNVCFGGAGLIAIVLAKHDLHGTPGEIGIIFGIAAAGGIAGAVLGSRLQKRLTFGQAIISNLWLSATAWTLLALSPNLAVMALIGAAFFLVSPVYDIVQMSYRLSLIPDELQGRVNSVYRLVALGGAPLGQLAAGALLEWVGARGSVLVVGAGLVVLALAATLNRLVREAPPASEVRPFAAREASNM